MKRCHPGGSLYFAGLLEDPSTHDEDYEYAHVPGKAIVHIGKHRYVLLYHGTSKTNRSF
jgi:hypothetical protein